jgi:uncharacterized protein
MNDVRFNDSDLDRLEQYLNAPERIDSTLPVDAIQGLFCAVVAAPAPIPPQRWLAAVLGESHEFGTDEERVRIETLLTRFLGETARQLNEGEGFHFILYGPEGEEEDFSSWADGYLMGVDLADPPWDEAADPGDIEEMLFPFLALTGQAKEMALEQGEGWMDVDEEKRMLEEVRDGLADHVLEIRRFWFEKSIPPTVKRESPKVGRNEPCPCGSGKKYKNCCGRQD